VLITSKIKSKLFQKENVGVDLCALCNERVKRSWLRVELCPDYQGGSEKEFEDWGIISAHYIKFRKINAEEKTPSEKRGAGRGLLKGP
jgi:hypothetical protein